MKKAILPLGWIVFVTLMAFFAGCKKHGNSVQCRIIDIKTSDTTDPEIELDYDSSKRLSAITHVADHGKKQTFLYTGNLIIRYHFVSFSILNKIDTITLGPNGLISTIVEAAAFPGTILAYDTMTYDNKNQLIKTVVKEAGGPYGSEVNYIWDNGDATEYTYNGTNFAYAYYADKKASDGDVLWIYDILNYGAPILKCNHLFKGYDGVTISYKFDGDGKITTASTDYGTSTYTYDYTYMCD